jgi:hypothetical protein
MFVRKVVADVFAEVSALGIGFQKVSKLLRRKIEVAIDLAAVESKIEPSAPRNVSCRCQDLGNDRNSVDRVLHSISRPIALSNSIMP